MIINYLFIASAGYLLGILFIFIFRKVALKYKILTFKTIPLVGGLAIALSFILVSLFGLFICQGLYTETIGIIFASSVMLIFGVIDDWRELSIRAKFIVQIVAVSILILFGVRTQIVYIGDFLNLIITYVWILAITNAFNHLDVIDGLATGCAAIASLAFFVVALLNGDTRIAILSLVLVTASLACFIYNFPPARIYIGNSGSHFLGFTLAAIALTISYAPMTRKIALFSPLLILGFPIFDTAFLILMRASKQKSIFKKSNDHLVFRFLRLGYSKRKALLLLLILSLFFSFSGILVSQVSNISGLIIIGSVLIVTLILTRKMASVSIDN